MKRYHIKPAPCPLPKLAGEVFSPEGEPFCRLPFAAIDRYAWGGAYRPEARAYVGRDDAGLLVLLCAREATIRAEVTAFGGEVWNDSCLEFFLKPFDDDPRYLNIEINAAGVALIAIGAGREDRVPLERCPEGMDIRASRHEGGWWAVAYALPFSLIEALYGRPLAAGATLRGNFYKCDESLHPHFGSWNPIEAPAPDFHRPECFGELALQEAAPEEYFDVCDERGEPTGEIVSRDVAHREGIRHRTAHVWVIRRQEGRWQALLQKRSANKDSFPRLYDTSSAGHIRAGDEPLDSALRELEEELGIRATPEQLRCAGTFDIRYEKEFHGRMFRDNELAHVYVYMEPMDAAALTLQAEEVERADWFDVEKTWAELPNRRDLYCVPSEGLAVLREFLAQHPSMG